ncbi:MAG: hypothetical protein EBX51_04740, partial [Acidimicrobiia bacterium]|nr:hypothetical protein [Acidimicrobiia bacterium]
FVVSPLALVARSDGVNEAVSSTAIRRALSGGDVRRATEMLGRHHEVRGTVVQGDKRGRTIGFPTANVAVDASLCLPADGVYAARVIIGDHSTHQPRHGSRNRSVTHATLAHRTAPPA